MAPHIDPVRSVITVGSGRGFVVMTRHHRRLIVTAAHCLPFLPPCNPAYGTEERTYRDLIGPLDKTPSVSAECLFADPIADVAVLDEPDSQDLPKEHDAYEALIGITHALRMSDPKENAAWLLSLDHRWLRCNVEYYHSAVWVIRNAAQPGIQWGMSGSPIFNYARTAAIGIVCVGFHGVFPNDTRATEGGPNPRLPMNLPAWMAPRAAPTTAPVWSADPVPR